LIVAIELAPSYIDAYNSKVDALVRLKKYENALEVLDNAFKINRYISYRILKFEIKNQKLNTLILKILKMKY